MAIKVVILLILCSIYTLLRYVYFGPVSPENIPLFLANKAISMASVFALLFAAISYFKKDGLLSRDWGRVALHTAFLHVVMSFPLINPYYYSVFYGFADSGRMDHVGELVLLLGILASYAYFRIARSAPGSNEMHFYKLIGSGLVAAHIFELGAGGWLKVDGWHGGMPPITLITTLAAIIAMVLYFVTTSPERRGEKINK